MSRIFISHSTANDPAALAIAQWLEESGWGEYFLDISGDRGLLPGERWQQALRVAADRCEAVLFLISPAWRDSRWCLAEFLLAKQLGKPIFGALIEPTPLDALPTEMTAEWQLCDLVAGAERRTFAVASDPVVPPTTVDFAEAGLSRLRLGLQRAGIAATTFEWPPAHEPDRSPYRGLRSLEAADAAVFFGREAAMVRGLDALRRLRERGVEQMFVIVGASGSGKSSYLRAGLWPRLARDDRHFLPLPVIRPARAVMTGPTGLAASLCAAFKQRGRPRNRADVIAQLQQPGGLIRQLGELQAPLSNAARNDAPSPTILISIDQGEELFASEARAESESFLTLLGETLVASGLGGATEVRAGVQSIAVVAIRSESLERLQQEPHLRSVARVLFGLESLPSGALRAVIEGPAERSTTAGRPLRIDPALTEHLLKDADGADALPLLAFTLERLLVDYGSDGELSLSDYEALGKVRGALEAAIQAAFSDPARAPVIPDDTVEREAVLRRGFIPWLTVVDPHSDERRRRVAKWDEIPPEARPLFERLIEARLLVRDRRALVIDAPDTIVVEIAHEALLRQWPALTRWLAEESHSLKVLESALRAASDWESHDRSKAWLVHTAERLSETEALLERPDFRALAGTQGSEYVAACRVEENSDLQQRAAAMAERERARERELADARRLAEAARRMKRRARIAGTLALAATVLAAVAWNAKRSEGRQVAALEDSLTASSFREAVVRVSQDDNSGAAAFLARALRLQPEHPGARVLVADLLLNRDWPRTVLLPGGSVTAVAWSPDGARVAIASARADVNTADLSAGVWDARTGQPAGPPLRHDGPVLAVALSSDPTRLITGSGSKAQTWDPLSGKQVGAPLLHYSGDVSSVLLSPDGRRVLTVSGNAAQIWDSRSGQSLATFLRHVASIHAAAWSPDGMHVVTGSVDRRAWVWDARTGQAVGMALEHQATINAVAWSPDGTRVVSGSDDNMARIWDARTGQVVGATLQHPEPVKAVAWSPDGSRVVTGAADDRVRLWDARTGQVIGAPLQHHGSLKAMALSPDGTRVLTGASDGAARVWSTRGEQAIGAPLPHQDFVEDAAWSPDGTRVVTGSRDKTAQIWNARTGQAIGPRLQHQDLILAVAWSPDGTRVVTASRDKTARIWDAGSGQVVAAFEHQGAVSVVAWSPDGARLVTGSSDRTARVWDPLRKEALATLQHQGPVQAVAWSPDGTAVATGAYTVSNLWNARTWQPVGTPLRCSGEVSTVGWSPDGTRVVTGTWNNTALVWQVDIARIPSSTVLPSRTLRHQGPVKATAWSPDGNWIVTSSDDNTAQVWDARSGVAIGAPLKHQGPVYAVVWSPDGSRVATGSADKTARVWDARTGYPVGGLLRHQAAVYALAWSPDGSRLITASADSTARIWDAPLLTSADALRLVEVAELLGGFRVTNDGALESIGSWQDRISRLKAIAKQASLETRGVGSVDALLTWFFADPRERPVSPLSELAIDEYVRRLMQYGETGRADVERNYPGNPALSQSTPGSKMSAAPPPVVARN